MEEDTDIQFQPIELADRPLIQSYFSRYPSRSCERTFANAYLWADYLHTTFSVIENTLVIKKDTPAPLFSFPAGEDEDIKRALAVLEEYCAEQGFRWELYCLTKENFQKLEQWYPGQYEIKYDRDDADYVYEAEKLSTLSGKKLHSKRNHIHQFQKSYPDWRYESLSDDNMEECLQMAQVWKEKNEVEAVPMKEAEIKVCFRSIQQYKELGLRGGILRVNGEIAAFSIGEALGPDTFVVHIEKALTEVEGAYPMINQQFVLHECQDFSYVNREEDTGMENLRKAKLSYHPAFLVEKGRAVKK